MWVLQEVGLAARATLTCGSATLEFEHVVTFARAVMPSLSPHSGRFNVASITVSYDDYIWSTYENTSEEDMARSPSWVPLIGFWKTGIIDQYNFSTGAGAEIFPAAEVTPNILGIGGLAVNTVHGFPSSLVWQNLDTTRAESTSEIFTDACNALENSKSDLNAEKVPSKFTF